MSTRAGGDGIGLNRDGHWSPSGTRAVTATASARSSSGKRSARSARASAATGARSGARTVREAAPAAPSRPSVAETQAMTASSLWPEPRPWSPNITLAALRLRLEHGASDPRPRPEGLEALGRALAALDMGSAAMPEPVPAVAAAVEPLVEAGAVPEAADRVAAYREAVLAAAEALAVQEAAEAALAAHDGARPPASGDILARMDAIAMLGTAGDDRRAEFAALRDAYDAALVAETDAARAPATGERAALLVAASEAARDAEAARAALASAETAALEGREVPPEILVELHRLLGVEAQAQALGAAFGD